MGLNGKNQVNPVNQADGKSLRLSHILAFGIGVSLTFALFAIAFIMGQSTAARRGAAPTELSFATFTPVPTPTPIVTDVSSPPPGPRLGQQPIVTEPPTPYPTAKAQPTPTSRPIPTPPPIPTAQPIPTTIPTPDVPTASPTDEPAVTVPVPTPSPFPTKPPAPIKATPPPGGAVASATVLPWLTPASTTPVACSTRSSA